MTREHRRKRSSYYGLALQYWLSAVAQQKQLMAFILTDSTGLLVAASFKGPEAEELAALAPLLVNAGQSGSPLAQQPDVPLAIRKILIDRSSLYLCAIGESKHRESGLKLAAGGIRRILNARES